MVWDEASTIQKALVDWAVTAGWEPIPGEKLPRNHHDVIVVDYVKAAIIKLNPELAQDLPSAELVLDDILTAITSAADGLVEANERLTVMLRGEHSFVTADGKHVPRTLINFDDPAANKLVVSDEVTIGAPGSARRFDIAYFVNGFPLVVVETKNPVNKDATWLTAANDIRGVYEVEYPNFFAPNVFSVATDGNQLRVGAVGSTPNEQSWSLWGSTELPATLTGPKRTEEAAKRLLTPASVLRMLETFTLFRHPTSADPVSKTVARYPQVEAAIAIYDKVRSATRGAGGLIWHHQGSGKTLLMAFAAFRLLKDPEAGDPTVVILCDRTQLVRQAAESFATAGMPKMHVPVTSADLRKLLKTDERGVIFTTIHKFADAGEKINSRDNIVVMVDEAHRTQEGSLGEQLRAALPNARFFGMTGTPVTDKDRNTFTLFGDPADPDFVMSRYEPTRSIVDGTTVPVHVEARPVSFGLDKEALDAAFDELAEAEGIDEEAKVFLSGKAAHAATLMRNPERIQKVCSDIVEHYLAKFRPLDMKAQVVALDREMVVLYASAIRAELDRRRRDDIEVGINISVQNSKSENPELKPYALTEQQEEEQKRRFCDVDDQLCFLVVTSKLMTGFDAPIEGVLYLDKPIKRQNLFQTITRPNRTWTHPKTKQIKKFGLVVDYIGLAKAIGDALVDPSASDGEKTEVVDTEKLAGKFVTDLATLLGQFAGIDMTSSSWETFAEARERIAVDADLQAFTAGFIALETVWEFLYPHGMLEPFKDKYRWLGRLYQSLQPSNVSHTLLWAKLGTKTNHLIHSHMTDIKVSPSLSRSVKLDAAGLAMVKALAEKLKLPVDPKDPETINLDDVVDSIEARIKRRMGESNSPVYRSLAERIEKLRQRAITTAEDSLAWLKMALEIARDVVAADRMDADGTLADNESLFDPKQQALSQIIDENKPDGLHVVVTDVAARIDAIVGEVAFTGWRDSTPGDQAVKKQLRLALKQFHLPVTGELFDRAYAYVRENY